MFDSLMGAIPAYYQNPPQSSTAWMNYFEGRQAQQGENYDQAIRLYQSAQKIQPKSAEIALRLSECFQAKNETETAWTWATKARSLDPQNPSIVTHMAQLAYFKGLVNIPYRDTARVLLLEATKMNPSDPELWARDADLAEKRSDIQRAIESWETVGRLRPQYAPAWERLIGIARNENRYELWRTSVNKLIVISPKYINYLDQLAGEQIKREYFKHAEISYTQLNAIAPNQPDLIENLSLIQMQNQSFDDARKGWIQLLELRPTHKVRFNLAQCEMHLGEFTSALASSQKLWDEIKSDLQDPLHKFTRRMIFQNLLLTKRWVSLKDFAEGFKIDPKTEFELNLYLFISLVEQKDFVAAKVKFNILKETAPLDIAKEFETLETQDLITGSKPYTFFDRQALQGISSRYQADLFAEYAQWNSCLNALKAASDSGVITYPSLVMQSQALDELGQTQASIEILKKTIKAYPGESTPKNNLGYALLLHKPDDTKDALVLIQEALRLEPNNPNFLDSLGWYYYRTGDFVRAETKMQEAFKISPKSYEINKHLGETLEQLNRLEEALEYFSQASALAIGKQDTMLGRIEALKQRLNKQKFELSNNAKESLEQ